MRNDTDDTHEFTIDGAPGEHTYETTIEATVTFFEAPFAGKDWYGLHMADVLRGYVRMKFAAEGSMSTEQVADKLSEQAGPDVDAESLLRQLKLNPTPEDTREDRHQRHCEQAGGHYP